MTLKSIEQAKSESVERAVFTNCGKTETPRNADKTGKKEAYPRSVQGVPADGVLHPPRAGQPDRTRCLGVAVGRAQGEWSTTRSTLARRPRSRRSFRLTVKGRYDRHQGQRPRHPGEDDRGHPRLQHPGVVAGSLRLADTWRAGQRAEDNPADGVRAQRAHGEEAAGKTIIEAHGVAHHIVFAVDHIRQEPKIEHTTKASSVVQGTKITVDLPALPVMTDSEIDAIEDSKRTISANSPRATRGSIRI